MLAIQNNILCARDFGRQPYLASAIECEYLLRVGCHRTGRRAGVWTSPLYRFHSALAWVWTTYLPAPLVRWQGYHGRAR